VAGGAGVGTSTDHGSPWQHLLHVVRLHLRREQEPCALSGWAQEPLRSQSPVLQTEAWQALCQSQSRACDRTARAIQHSASTAESLVLWKQQAPTV